MTLWGTFIGCGARARGVNLPLLSLYEAERIPGEIQPLKYWCRQPAHGKFAKKSSGFDSMWALQIIPDPGRSRRAHERR